MAKPVLLLVDDDQSTLTSLERDLSNRFGADYDIVTERSRDGGLATLDRITDQGGAIAVVIAAQRDENAVDTAIFVRALERQPHAKRVMLAPMVSPEPEIVLAPMTRGVVDDFLLAPWGHPEEKLYAQISGLLSAWIKTVERPTVEAIRIVGSRWSAKTHQLRDQLERNSVAIGFYPDDSEEGQRLLAEARQDGSRLPVVLIWDGRVLIDPSMADLARVGRTRMVPEPGLYDLAIVGAGPAGLAAAVYGASEGLRTLLIEQEAQGGQAGTSSMIRNYLGFPRGIGGQELAARATEQAWLFGTSFCFNSAIRLRPDGPHRVLTLADGSEATARSVILATGISYRRLDVPGLDRLAGAGVYFGSSVVEAKGMAGLDVFVVGAGNSAGQAAVHLAKFAARVTIVMRAGSLAKSMSDYLVQEVGRTANITVVPHTEVTAVFGQRCLEGLTLRDATGTRTDVPANALFIMIGALPHTDWLTDSLICDERGFLVTGPDLIQDGRPPTMWPLARLPLPMETCLPGVFAVGDVRHRSVKRVASAVGAGCIAIQYVHEYLAEPR
jgi:thioredoxin reductase (NADPH)